MSDQGSDGQQGDSAASCIFCNRAFGPDRKRTREHAAPTWCASLVPDRGRTQHTGISQNMAGTTTVDMGLRNPFTTVVNQVCEQCNTGWMSQLEASSQPLLGPLIQGGSTRLDYWRQAIAATWAVKTALVWDSMAKRYGSIPTVDYQSLYRLQRPTWRQQVWTGRYSGDDAHSYRPAAAHIVGSPFPGPDEAPAYLAALYVSQLVFVVFGQHFEPDAPYVLPLPLEFASNLIAIWPLTHEEAEWPPRDQLDDNALESVARALGAPIR